MTMMDLPPVGQWRVTGQVERKQLLPGMNTLVDGQSITFVTGYGTVGSVWVAYTSYNAADVQRIIGARVKELDAISTLGSHTATSS